MRSSNEIMDGIRQAIPPEIKTRMELSVAIANRIYKTLEQRNLTQKEFAGMMGKTETEVSRWLSGTHNLTISTIAKISNVLGEDIIQTTPLTVFNYSSESNNRVRYLSDPMTIDYGAGKAGGNSNK